jgi:hypothetical protein
MHAAHNPFVCFEGTTCSVNFRRSNILAQLLEAIGVLTKEETQKSKSRETVYQDAATESLSDECENEAAQMDDGEPEPERTPPTSGVRLAIFKVLIRNPVNSG